MPRRFGLLVDNFRAECFADKPPDTDHVMVFLALMDCTTSSSSRAAISRPPKPTASAKATAMAPSSNPNARLMMSLATPHLAQRHRSRENGVETRGATVNKRVSRAAGLDYAGGDFGAPATSAPAVPRLFSLHFFTIL